MTYEPVHESWTSSIIHKLYHDFMVKFDKSLDHFLRSISQVVEWFSWKVLSVMVSKEYVNSRSRFHMLLYSSWSYPMSHIVYYVNLGSWTISELIPWVGSQFVIWFIGHRHPCDLLGCWNGFHKWFHESWERFTTHKPIHVDISLELLKWFSMRNGEYL